MECNAKKNEKIKILQKLFGEASNANLISLDLNRNLKEYSWGSRLVMDLADEIEQMKVIHRRSFIQLSYVYYHWFGLNRFSYI